MPTWSTGSRRQPMASHATPPDHGSMTPSATLVVRGRIATLAGVGGPAWADAIGISGGRVVAAGTVDQVDAAARSGVRVLELAPDEVAVPGLTDSHLHLVEAALTRSRVQLEDAA